jgi:hypothetical protein
MVSNVALSGHVWLASDNGGLVLATMLDKPGSSPREPQHPKASSITPAPDEAEGSWLTWCQEPLPLIGDLLDWDSDFLSLYPCLCPSCTFNDDLGDYMSRGAYFSSPSSRVPQGKVSASSDSSASSSSTTSSTSEKTVSAFALKPLSPQPAQYNSAASTVKTLDSVAMAPIKTENHSAPTTPDKIREESDTDMSSADDEKEYVHIARFLL